MKRVLFSLVCAFLFPGMGWCCVPGCLVHGSPKREERLSEQ